METPVKSKTDTAISIVGAIFGTTHFLLQSAADITAHAEANLVHKISKGEISKEDTLNNRRAETDIKQAKAMQAINNFRTKIKERGIKPASNPVTE